MKKEQSEPSADGKDKLSMDEIKANMKHDLGEAVDGLTKSFASPREPKGLTIKYVEGIVSSFIDKTRAISLDSVSDMLTNYDEGDLISSKKANLQKEG